MLGLVCFSLFFRMPFRYPVVHGHNWSSFLSSSFTHVPFPHSNFMPFLGNNSLNEVIAVHIWKGLWPSSKVRKSYQWPHSQKRMTLPPNNPLVKSRIWRSYLSFMLEFGWLDLMQVTTATACSWMWSTCLA